MKTRRRPKPKALAKPEPIGTVFRELSGRRHYLTRMHGQFRIVEHTPAKPREPERIRICQPVFLSEESAREALERRAESWKYWPE